MMLSLGQAATEQPQTVFGLFPWLLPKPLTDPPDRPPVVEFRVPAQQPAFRLTDWLAENSMTVWLVAGGLLVFALVSRRRR